jgi:two-component system, OmpR family, sensor histidine kinase MprB
MSLRARFALAFALVGAIVAGMVGALSYHAAAERVTAEIDRTLGSVTTALANGQKDVLDYAGPNQRADRRGGGDGTGTGTGSVEATAAGSWSRSP